MQPFHLKWMLRAVSYRYDEFVSRPHAYYADLIKTLCDRHAVILEQIAHKQPSTGIVALAIGLDEYPRERYILSGFSFERTHAYGRNPDIDERGTEVSAHAPTDIAVLRYLAKKLDNVYTTEPTVYENTGVPLLPAQTAKLEPLSARASGAPGPSP